MRLLSFLMLISLMAACSSSSRFNGDTVSYLNDSHSDIAENDQANEMITTSYPVALYKFESVAWAVNVGGRAHTDIEGVAFEADGSEEGAGTIKRVIGAQDETVFRSFREGEFEMSRDLPDGIYDITVEILDDDTKIRGTKGETINLFDDDPIPGCTTCQVPFSTLLTLSPG